MILYQLDEQNRRCKEIIVPLEKGKWTSSHWHKTITVHFNDFEVFEPYRYFPDWCYKTNPEIADVDCKINSANIAFRFTEENFLKISGTVSLPYYDAQIIHKLKVDVSTLDIAKMLATYFATSPDQQGHSINDLQSPYQRFVDWCYMFFSADLTRLDTEDQECYISALYDAFKELSSNFPFIPHEPFYSGQAAIHWKERGEDGLYSVNHHLFMNKAGRIFHYCEEVGALFFEVKHNEWKHDN